MRSCTVLGIGDKVCKTNDELKLERDESSDFYVLMTCHRDLWCACAHIFQIRRLGERFEAGALNRAYAVFIKNRELCLHQDNMYLYPLVLTFILPKGGLQE